MRAPTATKSKSAPPSSWQAPAEHVSPVPHAAQAPPPVPHAPAALPGWQPAALQQPAAHDALQLGSMH
jgi:hypothetical protein